jgi:lysozyme
MTYSKNCQSFVASFEGLRLTAYQDSVGVWTIGYGHTLNVTPGMVITEAQAFALLAIDLGKASNAVNYFLVDKGVKLTQDEFDALCDFVFNLGATAFQNSTMLKLLLAGHIEQAAYQFDLWDHAGGKMVAGLLRRRQAETELFEKPDAIT